MRINPCHGCPLRIGCELRDQFRKRAAGTGARSITFTCPRLREEIRPGRRVVIARPRLRWNGNAYDPEDAFCIDRVAVPVTVLGADRDGSFSAVVDREAALTDDARPGEELTPAEINRRREERRWCATMRHARIIRFLDEPDRPMCSGGNPVLPEVGCDHRTGCSCSETWRSGSAAA